MWSIVLNNLHINQSAKYLKELADYSGETAYLAGNQDGDNGCGGIPGRASPLSTINTMDSVIAKTNDKAGLAWLPEK